MDRGTHVAVMFGPHEAADTFLETMPKALAEWGVFFDDDAGLDSSMIFLNQDQYFYGFARFVTVTEAKERYASSPYRGGLVDSFMNWRPICPYLTELEPIGFVEWMEIGLHHRSDFVIPMTKEGKGLIASVDGSASRPAVVERAFSLGNLQSKWGFDDGDVFLTRHFDGSLGNYCGQTWDTIDASLKASGIEHHFGGPDGYHHNLYRSAGELRHNGKLVTSERKIAALLEDVEATLWVYDFQIAKDTSLFPDV